MLTTLALVFEGFDIQAIAFAAPRLMSDWDMDRAALAPILAAGLRLSRPGSFRRSAGHPSSCRAECCRAFCCWRWPGCCRNRPNTSRVARKRAKELATTLNRVLGEARYDGSERFTNRDLAVGGERVGPLALFSAEHRRETLVIWLIFFTNVFTAYCYFNWTPTVLSAVGLSLATALIGLLLYNLGGVIGALLGAWWMGHAGSRPVLLPLAGAAALSTLALGWVEVTPEDNRALMACLLIAGAGVSGVQVQMYTVAASAYPTQLRATGVGWATGTARLGGVLSAFAGSVVQVLGSGLKPFFTGVAVVIVATFAGLVLLRRHLPPRG